MSKPKLSYILATNLEHEGIRLKVEGQLAALRKRFHCRLVHYRYKRNSFFSTKILAYFRFELTALFTMLLSPTIYVRYNPKSIFLNLLIIILSYFKVIHLEHNVIYETELRFLKRHIEAFVHRVTLFGLGFSNCKHIALTREIQSHLKSKGLRNLNYAQNGYLAPSQSLKDDEQSVLQNCIEFSKGYEQVAIFCGNGYPWHGLTEVLELISSQENLGLIVVGPYPPITEVHCLHIPHMGSALLTSVMEHCDYGIGTFRWDMLSYTEGCPLKSRQMLCHGLPILVNYYDCAADFEALRPFVIDYREHKDKSFMRIHEALSKKDSLIEIAREHLSWDAYFSKW